MTVADGIRLWAVEAREKWRRGARRGREHEQSEQQENRSLHPTTFIASGSQLYGFLSK